MGESLPPLWVVSLLQGEAERNFLLQPHPLPRALANSARSLSTSQVSVFLEASAFVLLPTASGRSWSCCPSRVGHKGQRNPVTTQESPGPITTWAMLCPHSFLPLAIVITEPKQFFFPLELISPSLRVGRCESRVLCATTTSLCLRVQRSLFKPVQMEDVCCHTPLLGAE